MTEAERIALEERIAHAEMARDNAIAMRDEIQQQARDKTRRAGEEIARMREVVRQLSAALSDLVEPHSSWCMGHEGGVVDSPEGRVGVGPLVVVDCRCSLRMKTARKALEASSEVVPLQKKEILEAASRTTAQATQRALEVASQLVGKR
jgi:hypothetical protein